MSQIKWVEREEELSIISVKEVVEEKGKDKSAERGIVHDEK